LRRRRILGYEASVEVDKLAGLLFLASLGLGLGCRGEGEVLDLSEPLSEPATGRCALDILDAASGLSIDRTLTSDWESGSCYELMLTNDAESRQEWWVLVELTPDEAVVDTRWNHTSTAIGDSVSEWRGIASSNNTTLEAGASTVVGACFTC
jgi:cellulase/cellobiase CelA1